MRDGRENETVHSCFIGPLRPILVTEVGWAVVAAVRWEKNEDEVNDIHAGYRILPSRARPQVPSFRLFFFIFSSTSRALRSSHFLRSRSLMNTLLLVFYIIEIISSV